MLPRPPHLFSILPALALLALAVPARADNAVSPDERGFVLVNHSGQMIDEAEVMTTEGKVQQISPGADIAPAQRYRFRMGARQCVAAVAVRLHDGQRLRADHLADCNYPLIVVTAHGISAQSEAR